MNSTPLLSVLSILGLVVLILMYLWAPDSEINQSLILTLFILICLGGMWAASYPQHCTSQKSERSSFRSHHPDCDHFQSHTLTIRDKRICAGCSGLFLGALLGIVACILYYLYGFSSPPLFWIGVTAVFMALLQLNYLKIDNAPVKFISNLVLVMGSAAILLGILESKAQLSIYFLVLIGLWIYTRTTVSATDHDRICGQCSDTNCPYTS